MHEKFIFQDRYLVEWGVVPKREGRVGSEAGNISAWLSPKSTVCSQRAASDGGSLRPSTNKGSVKPRPGVPSWNFARWMCSVYWHRPCFQIYLNRVHTSRPRCSFARSTSRSLTLFLTQPRVYGSIWRYWPRPFFPYFLPLHGGAENDFFLSRRLNG